MVKARHFLFCLLLCAIAALVLSTKDTASSSFPYRGGEGEQEQYGKQETENSPYVFEEQHYLTGTRTQHGRVRALPMFNERSKLLKGIENYRFVIVEANPQTFIMPNHCDAEAALFVTQGRGTLSLVRRGKRNSFNIQAGDIVRVHPGTTTYLINRDNNENLVIASLYQTVSTPGQVVSFFGTGGRVNPRSYFNAFSSEILEAALNVRRDRFQRVFEQQREGIIVRASEEQIRAMSQHGEGGIWPFGVESKRSINIFRQQPLQSNQYGTLYEVNYMQQEKHDMSVSFANITEGGMLGPMYSSRATRIALVVEGEGYLEMSCPHLSSESGSQGRRQDTESEMQVGTGYQMVRTRLRPGKVVIIPAGHPFVNVASNNQNLKLLYFNINAHGNENVPLTGRNNVMSQLEREAMELAFGVPAKEVEEIFRSQQEEFFFQGPGGRQGGRANA